MHRRGASMADIGDKEEVERVAVAFGSIKLENSTVEKIKSETIKWEG